MMIYRLNFTENLHYPYIEGACYRGGECFSRYEIPGTEMILDIDPNVFAEFHDGIS